jgi:riboflavin synthase
MFTGIIEAQGKVEILEKEGDNLHITISSPISHELKIDQSVSHNGVCLTVIKQRENFHKVTAVRETLEKSNIGNLKVGDLVNLERSLKLGDRMDGHIVQGHVDGVSKCVEIENMDGSWVFTFQFDPQNGHLLIEKGSACINGVSLTLVNVCENRFSVAIIPYTFENTNFKILNTGMVVNIEYDVLGKYVAKMIKTGFTQV